MKRIPLLMLLASVAFTIAQAKAKKPVVPPAIFGQAKFVYVETQEGDAYTPGLLPEDLQAIFDVQNAIRKWNRYQLTARPDQAELVFVVRTGRIASVGAHAGLSTISHSPNGGVGSGNANPPGSNVGGGVEVGSPDDLLWVYMRNPDGTLSAPIWTKSEPSGLRSHSVPLLEEVRNEVDAAYPLK
jgi:hypothetical protein